MTPATDSPRTRFSRVRVDSLLQNRAAITFITHFVITLVSYTLAIFVQYEGQIPGELAAVFGSTVSLLLLARLTGLAMFKIYRASWLHVGLRDLIALLSASAVGSGLFAGLLTLAGQIPPVMPSVLLLEGMFFVFMAGGLRFGVRILDENGVLRRGSKVKASRPSRALVIGAGEAGEALVRQLQHDARQGIDVVGLVDDDPRLQGTRLHGVAVLGDTTRLAALASVYEADLLIIAIPNATAEQMRRIVKRAMETGVPFKTVPSLRDLLHGSGRLSQLRNVDVVDLLGRQAVELALVERCTELKGATVLVTGGAGSIGSELARQLARLGPGQIVLVDVSENGLYRQQLELGAAYPNIKIVPFVGSVTQAGVMHRLFMERQPRFVFHAAAHKHVPLMERQIVEAVRNNVLGTLSVARAAVASGVPNVTFISTDKAINPSSVMGATKRAGERIVLELPKFKDADTRFCAVRFGNVLGSDGSVVPLFKAQLSRGGPLTVTHPEVTRYFMTIPEAVQLVLAAAIVPEAANRICMLEMGEPVRILELAENLIRLAGFRPQVDVEIKYTGLRPGEKLHEEVVTGREAGVPSTVSKLRILERTTNNAAAVEEALDQLQVAVALDDGDLAILALCRMVPEHVSPLSDSLENSMARLETFQHRSGRAGRRWLDVAMGTGGRH